MGGRSATGVVAPDGSAWLDPRRAGWFLARQPQGAVSISTTRADHGQ
jgi:hypothetical protein